MELTLRITGLQKTTAAMPQQPQTPAVQVTTVVAINGFPQPPNTASTLTFNVPAQLGDKLHIDELFVLKLGHAEHNAQPALPS